MNANLKPGMQIPRDSNVWQKTEAERKLLQKLRHSDKSNGHFYNAKIRIPSLYDKIIIQLYKNNQFNKTTYSHYCWQKDIPEILNKYSIYDSKSGTNKSLISFYSWNGKKYKPTELPH